METSRRSAADIKRCLAADEHDGAVLDVQWIEASNGWVISGGADSCVKLWTPKTASCPWTSGPSLITFVPDRCFEGSRHAHNMALSSACMPAEILHLWTGFDFSVPARAFNDVKALSLPCPLRTSTEGYDAQLPHDVKTLSIDPSSPSPAILVAYQNDPFFYRVRVDPVTGHTNTTAFGDPFFGSTSVVVPFFTETEQSSFVFVGDHLGCVSLYAWDTDASRANPITQAIGPVRKFEAHRDGASVTAIAWNGLTLVTGSVRGATHVWDALTFAPLRSFVSPVPRLRGRAVHPGVDPAERESVRHILISAERDALFVGVWRSCHGVAGGASAKEHSGWR